MINPPMNVPPIMLSGLDLIIIQARLHVQGKTVRKITEVSEVAGMEGDKPRLNAIWKYDAAADEIKETGIPSKLREKICDAAGVTPAEFEKHVQQRMEIIRNMLKREISDIQTVTQIIQGFYSTR
jgi:flagellar protein FlaI